jgi:hypothetical protein
MGGDVAQARRVRVYNPAKVKRALEKRTEAKEAAADPNKDTISEREARAKYPDEIHDGDFNVWRKNCMYLGRPLRGDKVPLPDGFASPPEWRANAKQVREIVEKIREFRDKKQWVDPKTGKTYRPQWVIPDRYGITPSELHTCRHKPSRNLGGHKFEPLEVDWPRKKNSHGGKVLVWPEDQLEQFAAAKTSAVKKREAAAEFLKELLAGGPVYSRQAWALAKAKGFTTAVLRTGRELAGVLFHENGWQGQMVWYLPGQDPADVRTFDTPEPAPEVATEPTSGNGATAAEPAKSAEPPIPERRANDPTTPEPGDWPALLSASDLARLLGQPRARVEVFLRRLAEKNPGCHVETPNPRMNEPRVLYRTAVVRPALEERLAKWQAKTTSE